MKPFNTLEVWFVTGSQNLYGEETLRQVAADSQVVAAALNEAAQMPVNVVFKPVVTTPQGIYDLCLAANSAANCIGLITWMHTFSPAKMWIAGLNVLRKPFAHLHTQFNRDIPWATIDMDFMNLNQSAHGDREFGFIGTRLRRDRKVVVGHWQDPEVLAELGTWTRAAAAWHDWQGAKIARFADNMREVAVTEGDKVEAQIRFGYSVNGYAVGDLAGYVHAVSDAEVDTAGGRVRRAICGGRIAAQRRQPARRVACGSAHRVGHARFSDKRRLQRVHHLLRGSARAGAVAGAGGATPDGRRLWFRRRGRLEDGRAGAQR